MDHVRIDEGITRERKAPAPMAHRPGLGQFLAKLPADLDDSAIFERIAAGERPSDIAASLGVTPSALYHRYSGNPAYQAARKLGTAVRVDLAEKELQVADEPFTLARAREVHKAVAWRAAVEHPDVYGPKQEVTHVITGLSDRLQRAEEREVHAVIPQIAQHIDSEAMTTDCKSAAAPDNAQG